MLMISNITLTFPNSILVRNATKDTRYSAGITDTFAASSNAIPSDRVIDDRRIDSHCIT